MISSSGGSVDIKVFTDLEGIKSIADEWDTLALNSAPQSPMLSYAWLSCFFEVYCLSGDWMVVTAAEDGELRAVLPLVKAVFHLKGLPVQCLQLPNNHQTLSVDGLISPGYEYLLPALFNEAFTREPQCLCIHYPRIEEVSPALRWSTKASKPHSVSRLTAYGAGVEIDGDYEHYFQSLKKNFRSSLKRFRNRLKEQSGVSFIYDEADLNQESLDAIFSLEHSGWKGRDGTSILSHPDDVQFFRKLAEKLADRKWLSLQLLKTDSGFLAGNFSVNFNKTTLIWKLGYSDDFAKISPGTLLMDEVIRSRFADGYDRVDLLTNEKWYENWGMTFRPFYDLWVFRTGPSALLVEFMMKIIFTLSKIKSKLFPNKK